MDDAAEAAGREQRGTLSMRRRKRRRTSATTPRWDPAGRAFLGDGGEGGKVRVLAINGCGPGPGDALLAVAALGADGWPRYTAADALAFVAASLGKGGWCGGEGRRTWVAERSSLRRVFGIGTLRDIVAPLLIPCYDLATAASFLLSRAGVVPLLPRRRRREDSFDFNGRRQSLSSLSSPSPTSSPNDTIQNTARDYAVCLLEFAVGYAASSSAARPPLPPPRLNPSLPPPASRPSHGRCTPTLFRVVPAARRGGRARRGRGQPRGRRAQRR
uniref:Uncharacterized protein n=1 Tax=Oryza meridionalis TaxID=40149 RepID=A0A0E0E1S9_9ORYZ